jgi:hypothetical protein
VGDLLIFDFRTQTWAKLAKGSFVTWQWSQDGKYVYAVDSSPGYPRAVRVRVADKRIEVITTLGNIRSKTNSWTTGRSLRPMALC